jgi:REP element-mobilizing transposase RayT
MSQSLVKLYAHIVFSTKHRYPFLSDKSIRKEVHAYLGGICNTLDTQPIVVGGPADHVHILCLISKNSAVSRMVGELKRVSSIWIKTKGRALGKFRWQTGYGAFSIGRSEVARVRSYIENQERHHKAKTFQQEYRGFLEQYGIEYDEQYVWD